MNRQLFLFVFMVVNVQLAVADDRNPFVRTRRVPDHGIQPQIAMGNDGVIHMVYYQGDAASGNVFYTRSTSDGQDFSAPMRVNSQPNSAIATGTIRGAHLSLGRNHRVHVAWNGSGKARPKGLPNPDLPEDSPYRHSTPMLYTRMNDAGNGFQSERNLMTHTYSLDGGGSVAADGAGNVYVVWHANSLNDTTKGESGRAVWIAKSHDDGQIFARESRANVDPTGACGCCGLRAATDRQGNVLILYRSAMEKIHRDTYLLLSADNGNSFTAVRIDPWQVPQCVMSSASLHASSNDIFAAWETRQQVKFARVDPASGTVMPHIGAGGPGKGRKHPVVATDASGRVILVWTEGTGWQKDGSLSWQVFNRAGQPIPNGTGRAEGGAGLELCGSLSSAQRRIHGRVLSRPKHL